MHPLNNHPMKRILALILLCSGPLMAQTVGVTTPANGKEQPAELTITQALLQSSIQSRIPGVSAARTLASATPSDRQFYAGRVLRTGGDLRLPAGSTQEFRAGEAILLEPGFSVDSTVAFRAEIGSPLPAGPVPTAAAPVQKPGAATLPAPAVTGTAAVAATDQVAAETLARRAQLWQNEPNPAQGSTLIRYFIPDGTRAAVLQLASLTRGEVSRFPLGERGHGQLRLPTASLPTGVYVYHLLIDGKGADSKKLVVIR